MPIVAVICGGPSSEHEVSLASGEEICRQIKRKNRQVMPVFITRRGDWVIPNLVLPMVDGPLDVEFHRNLEFLFQEARAGFVQRMHSSAGEALVQMRQIGVNCALLALHGTFGEDGRIQGFFEMANMPYTGSGVLASALAMDKPAAIAAFRRAGLATPPGLVVNRLDMDRPGGQKAVLDDILAGARSMKFPMFVKPAEGGSSVGTAQAENSDQLIQALKRVFYLTSAALVEQAVIGREVSVGVIEAQPNTPVALPPTEIVLQGTAFFDYDAKYTPGRCMEVTPADLSPSITASIKHTAILAHKILGCYGYSRTDMILPADGRSGPVVLETNTLPGMTPNSILPQQAKEAGIPFEDLLELFINQALMRGAPLLNMGQDTTKSSRF